MHVCLGMRTWDWIGVPKEECLAATNCISLFPQFKLVLSLFRSCLGVHTVKILWIQLPVIYRRHYLTAKILDLLTISIPSSAMFPEPYV